MEALHPIRGATVKVQPMIPKSRDHCRALCEAFGCLEVRWAQVPFLKPCLDREDCEDNGSKRAQRALPGKGLVREFFAVSRRKAFKSARMGDEDHDPCATHPYDHASCCSRQYGSDECTGKHRNSHHPSPRQSSGSDDDDDQPMPPRKEASPMLAGLAAAICLSVTLPIEAGAVPEQDPPKTAKWSRPIQRQTTGCSWDRQQCGGRSRPGGGYDGWGRR